MKLPLFAWDEKRKGYDIFPVDRLETFEDNSQGFVQDVIESTSGLNDMLERHHEHFIVRDRLLKEKHRTRGYIILLRSTLSQDKIGRYTVAMKRCYCPICKIYYRI